MAWNWKRELPMLVLIVAGFVVSMVLWSRLPEQVPVHFTVRGEADGYASRVVGLLLMPSSNLLLYGLFWVLPTIDPGRRNYANFVGAYGAMRMGIVALLFGSHVVMLVVGTGTVVSVNLIMMLSAGVLFLTIGNVLGKVRPNWFIGVRTPWTLSSKRSWDKTHRVAGRSMVFLGLLLMALAWVTESWTTYVVIAATLVCAVGTVVYSWWVWHTDPNPTAPAGTDADPETA